MSDLQFARDFGHRVLQMWLLLGTSQEGQLISNPLTTSYSSPLTVFHHSSILPSSFTTFVVILFTGISITNINPELKQFRSLMIPPSVHYSSNIHSPFSRIHSCLSLTESLTVLIPLIHYSYWPSYHSLPYSKIIDKFTTPVHYFSSTTHPHFSRIHRILSLIHSLTQHSLSIHTSFILTIQPPLPYQISGSEFSLWTFNPFRNTLVAKNQLQFALAFSIEKE